MPAAVPGNASLREVSRALSLGGLHALPVLAMDGTPVGIVTSSDLIGVLIDQIERTTSTEANPSRIEAASGSPSLLVEVLRAAEVYLHSGQSAQQHARLVHAVSRATEAVRNSPCP
jgi:CBS domain-containing protein